MLKFLKSIFSGDSSPISWDGMKKKGNQKQKVKLICFFNVFHFTNESIFSSLFSIAGTEARTQRISSVMDSLSPKI